jgi:5'-methylthioadenosine phosphorylase
MIGIVGGTGLYKLDGLSGVEERKIETPYGLPSAPLTIGAMGNQKIAFLPRHGSHHDKLPHELNYRANVWALKAAGARAIISVSAVGSLAMEYAPGDLVIPSQYLDFTKGIRAHTFLGDGLVAHISSAEPVCPVLSGRIAGVAQSLSIKLHSGRTYACVEGPRLGNRAESRFLIQSGAHIVGMTNVPEVYLALEAQMAYASICVVTDYDCWLEDPSYHATLDKVMAQYKGSLDKVKKILTKLLSEGDLSKELETSPSRKALAGAVITDRSRMAADRLTQLAFLEA